MAILKRISADAPKDFEFIPVGAKRFPGRHHVATGSTRESRVLVEVWAKGRTRPGRQCRGSCQPNAYSKRATSSKMFNSTSDVISPVKTENQMS